MEIAIPCAALAHVSDTYFHLRGGGKKIKIKRQTLKETKYILFAQKHIHAVNNR